MLGFIGPRREAEEIKARLARFLREDLKLELNQTKTLITHGRTGAARFLGYEITVQHANHKTTRGHRSVNGKLALRVPRNVITSKSAPFLRLGKPERRPDLLNFSDHEIISRFGAQWRGYLQYYLLAQDVRRLNRLQWVMLTSMLKTLAGKHRSTVSTMADRYQTTIDTPAGPRVRFQTTVERAGRKPRVARFGGIPLKRQKKAVLDDRQPAPITGRRKGSELLARLHRNRCELCEQRAPGAGAPSAQTRPARNPGAATTGVGATDGQDTAQDPDRVPVLPRQHPPPEPRQHAHVAVTGEPVAGKSGTAGSGRGSLEKAP